MRGWRYEGHRHSLAARGISSSLRSQNDLYFYAVKPSRHEIKRIFNSGKSRKAALLDEEEFLEEVIVDYERLGLDQETLSRYKEKLADIKGQLKHIPGAPPRKDVKASSNIREGLFERYEWTSGRKPEFVEDAPGIEGTMATLLPAQIKEARLKTAAEKSKERIAEARVLNRLEDQVLSGQIGDITEFTVGKKVVGVAARKEEAEVPENPEDNFASKSIWR